MKAMQSCAVCGGSGEQDGIIGAPCRHCKGLGKVEKLVLPSNRAGATYFRGALVQKRNLKRK
jgi:hypothetical protein